ncbi:MAG: polysaccharide deacetylase family protein [Ignavibacteriales bacterium]|nr:polysaccharide deacetylase family protein [Ignavibacteriales bacterium]
MCSLRNIFRNIIAIVLSYSIILSGQLKSRISYISKNNIPLSIYFHNPDKKVFERVVKWFIKNGFQFISYDQFISVISNKQVMNKAVFISFDDGYEDNVFNVLPVLEKYKIPAIFFISTKPVEDGFFWFHLAKNELKNSSTKLTNLWFIPNQARVEKVKALENSCKNIDKPKAITITGLKKMAASAYIAFGNHTNDHVICTNCTDNELQEELKGCANKLIFWVGEKYINSLAYPNGNYSEKTISLCKTLNISTAFTTIPILISPNTTLYTIPRMGILDKGVLAENLLHAFGLWQPIIKKLKRIYK